MKFLVTSIIILSFLAVAGFGVLAMGHGKTGGCLAMTANGGFCPRVSNLLELVSFYSSTFKGFSTAVFAQQALAVFLVLFTLLILAKFIRDNLAEKSGAVLTLRFLQNRIPEKTAFFRKKEFTRWLALHENSPANYPDA